MRQVMGHVLAYRRRQAIMRKLRRNAAARKLQGFMRRRVAYIKGGNMSIPAPYRRRYRGKRGIYSKWSY